MFKHARFFVWYSLSILALAATAFGQGNPEFDGKWRLIPAKSSEIGLYGTLSLEFQQHETTVTLIQNWGTPRFFLTDTLRMQTSGEVNNAPVRDREFASNVFMGLYLPVGANRQITATWENQGEMLRVEERFTIQSSQGKSNFTSIHTYSLSNDKETLTYQIARSTRKSGPPIKYVLKREGTKEAYFMKLEDNWEINGKLAEQAFLISLQGLANSIGPRLYFIYPPTWNFNYTPAIFEFYQNQKNFTFTQLRSAEQALKTFKAQVKGYVVWDKSVRTSLIVAFTLAGLEEAVVVSEEMIPMMEQAGLKPVGDFRGQFTGKSDAVIYTWAYEQYWPRCSKDFIIWMGGESGNVMKPGVADWGIYKQAFFNDLSSKPKDAAEYALANKLLSEMNPRAMVMGWHSYAKDKEEEHVKLTSSYGLCVDGLHTLPNFSFNSQVPVTKGFQFKNHHNVAAGKSYAPKKKVYITCVQTDGLGLGAWTKPGRGEIPYAWETLMNYSWLAPAMLEFFYSQATPNDFFIGCLSGPGYMYPKAVPPKLLPPLIDRARELMEKLDLNVFEIMDYSEGAEVGGNTDLPKEIVDAYFQGMPNAIGFINGYTPSSTFAIKGKRPLISYDYYLSPARLVEEAVADLHELAAINAKRPYFLLMHVRETSDIKRVKSILDKLGPEFELVPLDIFLTMAGNQPTFQERFLQPASE